jgi:hypothetical protein
MQRFEPLTQSDCSKLCQETRKLLTPLVKKYGINLDSITGVCSRDADIMTIKTCFSLPKRPESVASLKEELDYRNYAEGFGLKVDWLGKEFQRGKFTYKVAGLKINSLTKCVVLQRSDGTRCQQDGKLVARYLA